MLKIDLDVRTFNVTEDNASYLYIWRHFDIRKGILRQSCYERCHSKLSTRFKVDKGAVNIYGNTGPGNERWSVVKFTVAPLILTFKIVYGPVSAWSKILYGPVEISIQNSCWPRGIDLLWPRIFTMRKTGKVSV